MADSKLIHPNIIYISTGVLDHAQILDMLNQTRERIAKILGKSIRCEFDINVACKSSGTDIANRLGFSYVFCTNVIVANILRGLNVNGSPRIEKKTEIIKAPIKVESANISPSKNWADAVEEEEAEQDKVIVTNIQLPPLFEIKTWPLNQSQQDFLRAKYPKGPFEDSTSITIKESKIADMSSVKEGEIGYGCAHNVLYTTNIIKKGTDPEHIRQHFAKFVSNPNAFSTKKDKDGKLIRLAYPLVRFANVTTKQGSGLHCFITFDPTSHDAEFTLLMRRQAWVDGQQLIFIHPWRTIYEQYSK